MVIEAKDVRIWAMGTFLEILRSYQKIRTFEILNI
jgi:hypothetical protein